MSGLARQGSATAGRTVRRRAPARRAGPRAAAPPARPVAGRALRPRSAQAFAARCLALLGDLHTRIGMTILMVTHHLPMTPAPSPIRSLFSRADGSRAQAMRTCSSRRLAPGPFVTISRDERVLRRDNVTIARQVPFRGTAACQPGTRPVKAGGDMGPGGGGERPMTRGSCSCFSTQPCDGKR